MKIITLALLLLFYPIYSFGECDPLYQFQHRIDLVGSGANDKAYYMVINDYIDKYKRNFRSESFFNKFENRINSANLIKDEITMKRLKENYNKIISEHYRFDSSIRISMMKLAAQKFTKSFYCLGYIFERGIGEKINYVHAWAWFYTAFAVDGVHAKQDLHRVWRTLNRSEEINAKKLADKYIRLYTNFNNTPSVTILK